MATTRFGRAFIVMTLAFALVLALVFLSWLLARVVFQWPAFAIALVFAGGLSVSGHDAVDPGSSWLSEVADWLHLSAAALWIGGLATMAVLRGRAHRSCDARRSCASRASPPCSSQ